MSDRNDLENALLKIEQAARELEDAAEAEDVDISYRLAVAYARQHVALVELDELRDAIRERQASA